MRTEHMQLDSLLGNGSDIAMGGWGSIPRMPSMLWMGEKLWPWTGPTSVCDYTDITLKLHRNCLKTWFFFFKVFRHVITLLPIQDDAGQLFRAQGPGNLPERCRSLLSRLGRIWVHRFTGKTPGPFPLQLLPHQLPTSLCAQVSQGQSRINTAANSQLVLGAKHFMSLNNWVLTYLFIYFICWFKLFTALGKIAAAEKKNIVVKI